MRHVLPLAALVLSGCASNSGVVPLYQDLLSVVRQGATGFSSQTETKLTALQDAQDYCEMKKLEFLMVEIIENKPPFALGNFPRTEVRFMCLNPEDPRLATQRSGATS
jgi:hypothetical protein